MKHFLLILLSSFSLLRHAQSKRAVYILVSVLTGLLFGCNRERAINGPVLFPDITLNHNSTQKTTFQELFPNYSITSLETTDESLLGGISGKVVKHDSSFYIRSINDIVIFNLAGKFVNKLSRVGAGPEEYESLYDFDVVPEKGEIWISSAKGINRYDSRTLNYVGLIRFPFFVNEFKYLPNGTIIICTNEEETLKICNTEGEVLQSFLKADMANISSSPVSFVSISGNVIWQLSGSNDVVQYNPECSEFSYCNLIPHNQDLATSLTNKRYMEKYGYLDQLKMVQQDFITISSFREIKDWVLMVLRYPDDKWGLAVSKDKTVTEYLYYPEEESMLDLEVIPSETPRFINTLICGESPDSFIFIFPPKEDENSNPYILEIFPTD